jgi:hypothetical protein
MIVVVQIVDLKTTELGDLIGNVAILESNGGKIGACIVGVLGGLFSTIQLRRRNALSDVLAAAR